MSWARLDDGFGDHPKVVRAGNSAIGCWVRCLTFAAKYSTGGFVDGAVASRYGSPEDHGILVDCGMWVPVRRGESLTITGRRDSGRRALQDVEVKFTSDGYFIRDYLQYHFTKEEVDSGGPRSGNSLGRGARVARAAAAPLEVHNRCTSGAQSARADTAPLEVHERLHHLPSHPIPSHPTPPQAPRAPTRDFAEGVVAPQRDQEPPPSAAEQSVIDRLSELGWRSKMRSGRFATGWAPLALRIVREQSLTIQDIDELLGEARRKSRGDPMDLLGTWINPDSATWRDVLADRRQESKHNAALRRGREADAEHVSTPKLLADIGPIYGDKTQ